MSDRGEHQMTVALERWRQLRRPDSSWRDRARATIRHVVDANPELVAEPEKLLKLIDAAYPFGERRYHPYVKWRAEYRLVEDALMQLDSPPDRADAEVFDVARDLLMLGKPADATAMLDELAPTRLGRRCPACGAARGKPCFAVEDKSPMVVPHDARVLVSRDHGPLFGAV